MSQPAAKQSPIERIPESQWVKVTPEILQLLYAAQFERNKRHAEQKNRRSPR